MKRTGVSQKSGKQYTYYCCDRATAADESQRCDFRTWDVPTKDDCPVCGQTMFKKSGKGFNKPFCINPECSNFLPEDKRGYRKKAEDDAEKKPAKTAGKTGTKTAAKTTKTAAKTTKTAAKSAKASEKTEKKTEKKTAAKPAAKTKKTAEKE